MTGYLLCTMTMRSTCFLFPGNFLERGEVREEGLVGVWVSCASVWISSFRQQAFPATSHYEDVWSGSKSWDIFVGTYILEVRNLFSLLRRTCVSRGARLCPEEGTLATAPFSNESSTTW